MSIQKRIKNLIDYCPQPSMSLAIRLKRHSLPIAGAVTAMLVLLVTFSIFYSGLAANTASPDEISKRVADWYSKQNETASFYESAYAKATNEQKEELDKIIADKSVGLVGEWRRPVLIAIGVLPKDQPRLTAEQAGKIYDSIGKDERTLESGFNKIAGAPDFVGGSGIDLAIYYLNDDRSEAIHVLGGVVASHYVFNDDGTYTRLPLGSQKLIDPGPSIAPQGTPTTLPIMPSPTEMPMPSPTKAP
jgi:hypothetical protein